MSPDPRETSGAEAAWAQAWARLTSLAQMAHSREHQGVWETQWGYFESLNPIGHPQEAR